jgi:photosystem II stability/assembly factor-like uncharacterized protein
LNLAPCAALVGALLLGCPGSEGDLESAAPPVWPGSDLVAVDVIDDDHVIVVSATGEIHLSSDSGLSWQRARVPAVAGLRSISMADRETGWVVGEGVILRTDEYGSSWRRQPLPDRIDRVRLLGVSAIDREHAIAVGEGGVRLRTEDAGRTWQDVSRHSGDPSELSASIVGIFCDPASDGRCWSVGDAIQRTHDAGRTWQGVEVKDLARIEPISFGVGQVEVADSEVKRFERFLLANRHRRRSEWRIEPGISPSELEQIGRRIDPDALFEVIAARMQEIRSMIEGAGIPADRVVAAGAPPWDYEDYLDDDPDLLARYWSARSASRPSVRVRIVDDSTLHSLEVQRSGRGLAVGAAGALLRSADAGAHWTVSERFSPHDLFSVGFGRRCIVAVGAQGGIWLSVDDGTSWSALADPTQAPFFDALRDISFSPSGNFGMIVGGYGRMLRSLDGGAEWELLVNSGG